MLLLPNLRILCFALDCEDFSPTFFPKSFMVLRSSSLWPILSSFLFKMCETWVKFPFLSFSFLAYGYLLAPAPFVGKAVFPPLNWIAFAPLWKISGAYLYGSISGLFILSIDLCVYPSTIPLRLDCCSYTNLKINLIIDKCLPLCPPSKKIVLASLNPLSFHVHFRRILSISAKKSCWDFDSHCVKPE